MYYQRPVLFRILEAFCRHWRLFAATVATIVLLLLAFLLMRPKTYYAQYTVVTNNQALANPLGDQSGPSWDAIYETVDHFQTLVSTKEFIQTALNASGVHLAQPVDTNDEGSLLSLQKGINISAQGSDAFVVQMTYKNDTDTALIPQALIYAFIERNAEEKSAGYTQQVAFVQGQVDAYRNALEQSEGKLANFKAENIGHLPSQQEAAESDLTNLQQQVQRDQTTLNQDQEQEGALAAELTATPKTIVAQQVAGTDLIQQEITSAQQQINTYIVQDGYTMDHPKIKALTARISQLNAEEARAQGGAVNPADITSTFTRPNPQYDALASQESSLKIAATGLQAQIADEIKRLGETQAGVAKVPGEERQLANLTRDYTANETNYNLFSQKLTEYKLDEQINLRQNRSEYSVYMTAPPQLVSSKSKSGVLLLGGVLLALVVASGLVVLMEMQDRSFRDPLDLQRTLGVPVLAMLPESADLHVADSRNAPRLTGPSGPRKRLGFGRSLRQLPTPGGDERIAAAVGPKAPAFPDAKSIPAASDDKPGSYIGKPATSGGAGGATA